MGKNILNERQLEASQTLENPLLIIAGPGTGKTKTLVERVVNILLNKVSPKKIILTTFTNKAGNELKIRINERLEELNQSVDISEMYLGTMHSIWIRFIQENIKYSRFFDNFSVMSGDYEQHFFIYSRLKEYKKIEGFDEIFKNLSLYESWGISGFIRKKINDLNENAIDIKNLRTTDKYILFLKQAYELYEKQLIEENILDYSFLQVEILSMLKNEEFLEKINEKIDYIMVDEYQDSNKIQEKILLLLSKNKKNICVVGDEDQSIYRFRGASSENILNFPKHFKSERKNNFLSEANFKNKNNSGLGHEVKYKTEENKLRGVGGEAPNIKASSEAWDAQEKNIECKTIILNKNYRSVDDIVKFCD
ncbi:MAG: ATP-dependent helicase, partial [Fusobacterium sp.]|nr:ATP-dependent helicase [Fusobacterium sp.]